MKHKNYWIINENAQDDLKYTTNIHNIMNEQCQYLFQYSKGKIFAIFGEVRIDGSMFRTLVNVPDMLKNIASITNFQETIGEISTKDLIDVSALYSEKRYGFEICTNKYRFRLFEIWMKPLYPVEIIIDEGICKNIANTLAKISVPIEEKNHYMIDDEESFCNVLQIILQDKKVRYIIHELLKMVESEEAKKDDLLKKIIICEGPTDEVILQAIARKLNKKVNIVVANGKNHVPSIFATIKEKNQESSILIVVDSDGDEKETRQMIAEKIGLDGYEMVIINNSIEDWFMPRIKDFGKLKLMQSIDTIIEETDLNKLRAESPSFAKVEEFILK